MTRPSRSALYKMATAMIVVSALHGVNAQESESMPLIESSGQVGRIYDQCGGQKYSFPPAEAICVGTACPKLGPSAPKLPPARGYKCNRKERIPRLSVVMLRPKNSEYVREIRKKIPEEWEAEFIAFEDEDPTTSQALVKHMDIITALKDDYAIYTNNYLGMLRPINRATKFADAEVVLVLPDNLDPSALRPQWIVSAIAALKAHETLALVGMQGAEGSAGNGEMEFMHAVSLQHPMVIRRSAFTAVGLIDTSKSCPSWFLKEKDSWLNFCKTLWRHGLSVAAIDWEANVSAVDKARIPAELQEMWPKDGTCAAPTTEHLRGRQDCPHGPDIPQGSVIIQYFKRLQNVGRLGKSLKSMIGMEGADLMVNDDSQSEHKEWVSALSGAVNTWLVHSPNIHEIRGYNKLAKLANSEIVAFMQDDDHTRELDWMVRAKDLFMSHPEMALLGGRAGRLDTGPKMEVKGKRPIPGYTPGPLWQNDGQKYGYKYTKLTKMCAKTGIPFDFVYKVNASPLVVRRSTFLRSGMYHPAMSCVGESGISFDFEFSVRMWKHGYKVGLYYAHFVDFTNSRSTGTWSSANATRKRMVTWRRNNLYLYYMYPNFHHRIGTRLPLTASEGSDIAPLLCVGPKKLVHNRCPLPGSSKSRSSKTLFG